MTLKNNRTTFKVGQTTKAKSTPVVLPSDQDPIPISSTDIEAIKNYLDTVEIKLQSIIDAVDGLEGFTDGIEGLLTTLGGYVDQLEGYVDGLEGALTTLNAKDFATSTKQDTIIGHVDGIETALTAVQGYMDQLEGYVDSIESYVDGIEALLTTIDADTGNIATSVGVMDDWDNAASDGASVSGDVAHGTADAGEPVKIGAKVETSLAGITLEADGDRTNLYADADGVQVMKIGTTGADLKSESVSNTNGSATASGVFTAVASTYNYITAITVYNSSATAGFVIFTDGSGGATKWTMPLPAGGGATIACPIPLFKTSANTALYFDVSAALTTVYISLSGYQSKV